MKKFVIGGLRKLRLQLQSQRNFSAASGFMCGAGCIASKKNRIRAGRDFFMGKDCHLSADAHIGNDVMFGSCVALVGGDHRFDNISGPMRMSGRDTFKKIVIEDNVWVGHGAIILQGVTLRSGCVVAAGSVVTRDVESNAIVGGNPARFIRYRKMDADRALSEQSSEQHL